MIDTKSFALAASVALTAWTAYAQSTHTYDPSTAKEDAAATVSCIMMDGDVQSYDWIYIGRSKQLLLNKNNWSDVTSTVSVRSDWILEIIDVCEWEDWIDNTEWKRCIGQDFDADGELDVLIETDVPVQMKHVDENGIITDGWTIKMKRRTTWVDLKGAIQGSYEDVLKIARVEACED